MRSIEWWHCPWPWVPLTTPFSAFCTAIHSFLTGEPRDFKFGTLIYHSKSHPADERSSLKGAWSGSYEQFLHCGLRKFRHSKSLVYRWYPQLDRGRFVYDTYRTMKATRSRHGWVHMFARFHHGINVAAHVQATPEDCTAGEKLLNTGCFRRHCNPPTS